MPTLDEMQKEIDNLKTKLDAKPTPASVGLWLTGAMSWVSNNKAGILAFFLLCRATYREIWPNVSPPDPVAIRQIAKEEAGTQPKGMTADEAFKVGFDSAHKGTLSAIAAPAKKQE